MADRRTNSLLPDPPREKGMRDWPDDISGEVVSARLVAYNPTTLQWEDLEIDDATGGLVVAGGGGGGGGGDTELETPAALADGMSNPSIPRVGSLILLWNGTGWDRVRGDISNGLDVDVTRVQGTVTVADGGGSLTVDGPLTDAQLRAAAVPVADGGGSLTVDGSVSVGNFPAVQPVSDNGGSLTVDAVDLDIRNLSSGQDSVAAVQSGTWVANPSRPGTSTRTSVAGSASDVLLLAANASRLGGSIYNDSSAILYLALGTVAASSTDFTAKLFQDDLFEIPHGYTGQIRGVWASATGAARVTELT